ncbi:MAG TPA: hypothetical protein PKX64_08560, partial [Elusimicrobiota bacterium]|nr:hypothetical protein [Elusimicrobiota bacterium]
MTSEFVYAAAYTDGLALAKEFPKDTPAVMITGDQRWSTPALRQAAIDGYTAAGAHVYFSNERVSTPAANVVPRLGAFSVEGRPVLFHRVLQISASHDPWLGDASKNGMKMNGRKDFHLRSMEGPQVAAMLEGMFSAEAGRAPDPAKRGRSTEIHLLPAYTEFVARRFVAAVEQYGLERADLEKLVFVTDGGQGVMDDVTPGVVDGINRALRERFNDPAFSLAFDSVHPASVRGPDGTVEHPADPVEAGHFADHLKTEMDRVRAAHPGKIVVFAVLDGDGDRSGLMGADGKVLSSTQQAFLYFNRLLADRPADRERLRLDIRMGQEILELVGQVTPANQSMIDPGWSKQRRVLLQANAPGGIEGSYHTFVRISDDANTEPMDDGLVFSLDQALYELKLAREGTSSTELLAGRSWYPEMSEFRPKFIEAIVDDRYAVMPNITQAIIASVKSEFAAEKANVVVVESREEKGAARIQIYDDAGNFLGWVLMRTSNTNPVLSMKGQGRDAATLARLKRILKNALENDQFTGRFNQAEIDKGLGTVVPGSQAGFAQVSLLTLLASGLGAVVLALTGAPGVLVGFALVPGLLAAGMEAVRWWATGRGTPGRKPIAATPEREILEAAGVRRALTTPKVSVSPEMDKRQLQGGYKQ